MPLPYAIRTVVNLEYCSVTKRLFFIHKEHSLLDKWVLLRPKRDKSK